VVKHIVLIPLQCEAPLRLRLICSTPPGACDIFCIWRHEKLAWSECPHRFLSVYMWFEMPSIECSAYFAWLADWPTALGTWPA
jgi:hypothetical protein